MARYLTLAQRHCTHAKRTIAKMGGFLADSKTADAPGRENARIRTSIRVPFTHGVRRVSKAGIRKGTIDWCEMHFGGLAWLESSRVSFR